MEEATATEPNTTSGMLNVETKADEFSSSSASWADRLSVRAINQVLCLLALIPLLSSAWAWLYYSLYAAEVNDDAGFYLPVAFRIAEGWVPYRDLYTGYSPLGIFTFSAVRLLFRQAGDPFVPYVATVLLLQLLSAILLIAVSRTYSKSLPLAAFLAATFLAGCELYEGGFIFLEPFVNIFSLAAVFIFLSGPPTPARLFLSGSLVGFAFLSKQYGLAGLLPLGIGCLYGLGSLTNILKRGAWIAAGCALPILTLFFFFRLAFGIPFANVASGLWISGYIRTVSPMNWTEEFFLEMNPHLLLVPLLFFVPAFRKDRIFAVLSAALFAFALPAGIRDFQHYCLLIVPFAVLAGGYLVSRLETSPNRRVAFASILFLAAMCRMGYVAATSAPGGGRPPIRAQQYALAAELNKTWPPGTPVFAFANPAISFLANFYPAGVSKMAHSFPQALTIPELEKSVRNECHILVATKNRVYFADVRAGLETQAGDFYALLKSTGYTLTRTLGYYELWDRPCPPRGEQLTLGFGPEE